jgi:hypothetical protein
MFSYLEVKGWEGLKEYLAVAWKECTFLSLTNHIITLLCALLAGI